MRCIIQTNFRCPRSLLQGVKLTIVKSASQPHSGVHSAPWYSWQLFSSSVGLSKNSWFSGNMHLVSESMRTQLWCGRPKFYWTSAACWTLSSIWSVTASFAAGFHSGWRKQEPVRKWSSPRRLSAQECRVELLLYLPERHKGVITVTKFPNED